MDQYEIEKQENMKKFSGLISKELQDKYEDLQDRRADLYISYNSIPFEDRKKVNQEIYQIDRDCEAIAELDETIYNEWYSE